MNNMQIIANEAVASGFFTEEEVAELVEEEKDIPFHTFDVWKAAGFIPKAGTHGWECILWRKKNTKSNVDENEATEEERKREFYLTKNFFSYLSGAEDREDGKCIVLFHVPLDTLNRRSWRKSR